MLGSRSTDSASAARRAVGDCEPTSASGASLRSHSAATSAAGCVAYAAACRAPTPKPITPTRTFFIAPVLALLPPKQLTPQRNTATSAQPGAQRAVPLERNLPAYPRTC